MADPTISATDALSPVTITIRVNPIRRRERIARGVSGRSGSSITSAPRTAPSIPEDVVLGDGDDLVGHEAVPLPMDRLQVLRPRSRGETEHLAMRRIEPIGQELDTVLRLERDVREVRPCDLLCRDAGQVVTVHVERHQVVPSDAWAPPLRDRRVAGCTGVDVSAACETRAVYDSNAASTPAWSPVPTRSDKRPRNDARPRRAARRGQCCLASGLRRHGLGGPRDAAVSRRWTGVLRSGEPDSDAGLVQGPCHAGRRCRSLSVAARGGRAPVSR